MYNCNAFLMVKDGIVQSSDIQHAHVFQRVILDFLQNVGSTHLLKEQVNPGMHYTVNMDA